MEKFEFITVDAIDDITLEQLKSLRECGFCYIKIPEKLESMLTNLSLVGEDYFSRSEAEKQQFPHSMGVSNEGYLNHKIRGTDNIQRYVYHGNKLVEPFLDKANLINYARDYFREKIGRVVIKKIFADAGILDHYADVIKDGSASLSFICYPLPSGGLKAHKDTVLVTVLFITKPGLEVYIEQFGWQEVKPKPGYLVLNVGNSLELMTAGRYRSALHRVRESHDSRLSIASFIGPNPAIPLINYITGQQLYANFATFAIEQHKIIYPGL